MLLLSDPAVAAIHVQECGEKPADIRAVPLLGRRHRCAHRDLRTALTTCSRSSQRTHVSVLGGTLGV